MNEKPLQLLKGNAGHDWSQRTSNTSPVTHSCLITALFKDKPHGRMSNIAKALVVCLTLGIDLILCHFKALAQALKDRISLLFKENCRV